MVASKTHQQWVKTAASTTFLTRNKYLPVQFGCYIEHIKYVVLHGASALVHFHTYQY